MLLLSTSSITADGVTVFPDHADPNQFWYLPAPVNLATLPDSDEPQFLLIEYTPDLASSGVQGVGFLNVTLCLKLSDDTRRELMGQIRAAFPNADDPLLAPVPFDEGTVQIVALDLQGGGGASNTAPAGTFEAIEHILGAVSPELYGDNNALFALTLSEDGASILKAAFEDGMAPVGGIYNLKFTGARPALDVKITADLKRVYESFSVGLSAKVYWVTAGIDATFEKLRQDGAIKVEVINLAGDAANAAAEQQAMAMFKDQILSTWFTPSLSPTTEAAADAGVPAMPGQAAAPAASGATTRAPTSPPSPGGTAKTPASPATSGSMQATKATSAGMTMPTISSGSAQGTTATSAGMTTPTISSGAQGASATSAGAPAPAAASGGAATQGGTAANAPVSAPPPAASTTAARPAAPAPSAPQPAATGGQAAAVANAVAGAAAAASSAASAFGVSLKLKFVSQDEQKTVTYEYNRMDAVQRTYAPQGYFGLMLAKIDKSKHFLQVDGTDTFFRKFTVALTPPHDFASIGLQTAHVALDYGDSSAVDPKHAEFVFDTANTAPTSWDVFQGQVRSTKFTYTADYSFDPESGWIGAQDRYQLPPVTTENRQLTLDPFSMLGFLSVAITPGRIDPGIVDRVEVALQYADPSGWTESDSFIVRGDSKPQIWKLRLADKTQRTYSYTTRCVLKDGTVFTAGPVTSTASGVIINDAFNGGIDVLVQPAFDPTKTKAALIELDYEDSQAGYKFQNTLYLPLGSTQPTRMHIPVFDRAKTEFEYRVTTIGVDGQQYQGDLVTAKGPVVLVGDRP
jgi:hypothetical protein